MNLICVTTMMINLTTHPYNAQDFRTLDRAQKTCKERYEDGCVSKFQKRGVGNYRILCGEKEGFDRAELDKYELEMIIEEARELGDSEEVIEQKLKSLED